MQSISKQLLRSRNAFLILLTLALAGAAAEKNPEVPFPDGYRSWLQVKSETIGPADKSFATEGGRSFTSTPIRRPSKGTTRENSRMAPYSYARPFVRKRAKAIPKAS